MSRPVEVDAAYTDTDHLFRELDHYARAKYDIALRWLDQAVVPGRLVYNIGCGAGYFNSLAAERGCEIVACEPERVPYALALASAGPNVTVLNCGLEEFARDRPPADVVVMHDVLEHIEDDAGATAILARLVKPGGLLVVSVPAMPSLFGLHDELLGHFRRYRAAELKALMRRHFRILRFRNYGMLSIPIVLYFSRWRRVPYPVTQASSGVLGKAYGLMCSTEAHLWEPLGTSITLMATPLEVRPHSK